MNVTLSLVSDELDNDELQKLTRKLCGNLRDEAGLDAALDTREAPLGSTPKGDLPAWGQIVMTLIGSGGMLVTAIKVLEAYAKKNRKVKIKAKTAKGELTIETENRDSAELTSLLKSFLTDDGNAKTE